MSNSTRTVDWASAGLLILGLICTAFCYYLVTSEGVNVLIIVPAVVASTIGATNLFKRSARTSPVPSGSPNA